MSETYEKVGDDLAVTRAVTEETLLSDLAREEKKLLRVQARVDTLKDKLTVIRE